MKKAEKLDKTTIGLINTEFFHENLGGFGGYGSLCVNLTNHYNARSEYLFKVFLARYFSEYTHVHSAEVFSLKRQSNILSTYNRHRQIVKKEKTDLFVTIEWDHMYTFPLMSQPETPVVIWLQDPRVMSDWEKISSCDLALNSESNPFSDKLGKMYCSQSLNLTKTFAKLYGRKIIPATQARFLRKKGSIKYDDNLFLNSVFLPNPIEIPEWNFKKAAKPTILFLGRLDPIKRPWLFFELAKRLPDYDFLVAGNTHYPRKMNQYILEAQKIPNLHFLGLIGGVEKQTALSKSWLLVNTSIHEALPVSFLEALSYRTCIVSNQNPDDLTKNYGIWVENSSGYGYDSIPEFIRAVTTLCENHDMRINKAIKGYEYVQENHSFKKFGEQVDKIVDAASE